MFNLNMAVQNLNTTFIKTPDSSNLVKTSFFYMNDVHGQEDLSGLYNAARAHDLFVKNNNVDGFKLQSGDAVAGSDPKSADLMVHFFNMIGIDFGNLGNHEFDLKINTLDNMLKKAKYKVFGTNLDVSDESPLKKMLYKSYIAEKNGHKYGFLGIQPFELESIVNNKEIFKNLEVEDFDDTVEEIQEEVEKLKKQGVNKIILLSHVGLSNDKKLAKTLSDVDLIIGGHSHDIVNGIKEGENLFYSKKGEPVILVQAGRDGKHYGLLNVSFDENGVLKQYENSVISANGAHNLLTQYLGKKLIGDSPVVGTIKEIDAPPANRLIEPYAYANFVCDRMREAMNVDIAFINAANIRYIPNPGEITERMIEKSTPFKNNLIKTTMNEKEVIEAIKSGAKSLQTPDHTPGLVNVSGVKYEVDSSGELLSASILQKDGFYKTVNINNPSETKTYTVVYDDFLGNGKEYPAFDIKGKQVQNFDFDKDKLIKDFFKKQSSPVSIKNDGRLKIISSASSLSVSPASTIKPHRRAITPMQAYLEARKAETLSNRLPSNSTRNLAMNILRGNA